MSKTTPVIAVLFLILWAILIVYGDESKKTTDSSSAHYFPEGALIYAELNNTAPLFENVLDSTLWWNLYNHPLYATLTQSNDFDGVRKTVRYLENNLNIQIPQLLAKLFGQNISGALYEKDSKPVWIFISRHQNATLVKETVKSISQLVFMAGQMQKMMNFEDYEGISVLKLPKITLTIGKTWMAVSNDEDLLRDFYGRTEWNKPNAIKSIAETTEYEEALKTRKSGRLFGYAQYRKILTRMKKDKIFTQKPDEPIVTLLFGPLLNAIKVSDILTLSGDIQDDGSFSLSAGYAYNKPSVPEYEFSTYPPTDSASQGFVTSDSVLFSLDLQRDLGKWWENREALHSELLIPKFVEFNTIVGQLWGGVDVQEDIFGDMYSDLRLIGVQTQLDQGSPSPFFPGFVFSFRAKNPEKFVRAFRVGFQSAVGIANFERAKDNKEVLLICSEKTNQGMITGARWIEPAREEEYKDIHYNFSPCIARVENTFYLATSIESLRTLLNQPLPVKKDPSIQDRFSISGPQLFKILEKNHEILVWNKMVEVGGDQERAKNEIQLLLDIVRQFAYVELQTQHDHNHFFLHLKTRNNRLDIANLQHSTSPEVK